MGNTTMRKSEINKFFSHVLVINLDRRPDRMEQLIPELTFHNIEASRISAIDGKTVYPELKNIYRGWLGCTLSHINALTWAKQNKLSNILIIEDDVRFSEINLMELPTIIEELPNDWDMFYLGANDKHPKTILNQYSKHLRKAEFLLTTHAYAVNAKCYDVLINHLQSNCTTVVDVLYTQLQPQLKCYLATPILAWQAEGFSDILNQNVNYDFMKPL